jgi:hypothetical protein
MTGSYDASPGLMLMGDGHGQFEKLPYCLSGLSVQEDIRSSIEVKIKGRKSYVVGANSAQLRILRWSGPVKPDIN